MILGVLGDLFVALSVVGVVYWLAAATFVRQGLIHSTPATASRVPVSILKPLCGAEPGLADNLASFCRQQYGGAVQIVCGVQDPADPARGVTESLVQPGGPEIDLVVDAAVHGQNRKISNLINMLPKARYDLLVISDADIAVEPDYLGRIVAALDDQAVGLVTCYYFGQGRAGFWSRLAAMGVSYGFMPNVILGVRLGMATPCMGSTIALRRELLDRIGGFEAFADRLADDYEMGAAVRALGLRTAIPPFAVAHGCAETSLAGVIAHEMRWAVTIRGLNPSGHFGSVVTHPVPLALIGAVLLGAPTFSLAVLAAAIAARYWLAWSVDRCVGARSGEWWLLPLRDFVSFGVFTCSLFVRSVDWRGTRLKVTSNGKLFAA